MIVSRTPYRISFFGGGTDFPAWYKEHGGCVIATSIDKYCYITCRRLPPFFPHSHRIVWSKIEEINSPDNISHPAVKAALQYLNIKDGLEIHHVGDLPARSGIGSSSSFAVGLLNALHAFRGRMLTKHDLAMEAIHIEQEVLKEAVGSQDQVSAAYGGLNRIDFLPSGEVSVTPITVSQERIQELNNHLLLFYTGVARTSSYVQKSFLEVMDEKRRNLRILKDLVDEGVNIINSSRSITDFGELLREAWDTKRGISSAVTNNEIDRLYNEAISAGAMSGKITGAGGGGFLLLFVTPDKQAGVKEALKRFLHVPFKFEWHGSQIIFASHDTEYPAADRSS